MNFSEFCLDIFQRPNAKSVGISYFKSYRINEWLNTVNSYIKLHALVSPSEPHGHISKIQFVNGLNIKEILRGSVNSDCKFCLPIFLYLDKIYLINHAATSSQYCFNKLMMQCKKTVVAVLFLDTSFMPQSLSHKAS